MHAYAGTQPIDQSPAQAPSALIQLANGEDNGNNCGNGILNILNCNDVDVGVVVAL